MSGFYGLYHTTLDEKGRFALPAKLRNIKGPDKKALLSGGLTLTKGLDGCLALFPGGEWQAIQNRLSSLPFTKRDYRFFSRRFYPMAGTVMPDRNGRILIPAHLIAEAELKKELLVIGVDRWVEIWNPERFRYYLQQFPRSYEEVAERLFMEYGEQQDDSHPSAGPGG